MDHSCKRTKLFVFFMALSVVLCSFLELNTPNIVTKTPENPWQQLAYISQVNEMDALVQPEELSRFQSQGLFARQNALRRVFTHFEGSLPVTESCVFPYIRFTLLFGLFGCICKNNSQRFILQFIHNQDGQKA